MIKPDSKIDKIPKIGPKYKKKLEKLGIETVKDLVYHFPFRYEDYSRRKKIANLEFNETVTVEGEFKSVKNIFTKNKKKLTKAIFADSTGQIQIIWFNMHYIKKSIRVGERYLLCGKVVSFNGKPAFIAPEFEKNSSDPVNTARLVPIYPTTGKVSSKWIRSRIKDVIYGLVEFEELIPKNFLKKRDLKEINTALREMHFPRNYNNAKTAKARFSYEEMLLSLLMVESRKQKWGEKFQSLPFKIASYEPKIKILKKSLPFNLTKSQEESFLEICKDVSKKTPMNRILEGDVGTGKTIVAILASYLSYLNGYKTIYMAPTEILANQHFETFKKTLNGVDNDIKISLKTASSPDFDINSNIIIGTHALIYLEKKIKNIGLVIIDEQQRFGVEQRAKLSKLSPNNETPHFLTMTATPIPRTLALTLFGDLAISTLDTPPQKYKNIKTWIIPKSKRKDAYEWVKKQNKQVFVVCPLIKESEFKDLSHIKAVKKEFEFLKKGPFNDLSIGMIHGELQASIKQEQIDKFAKGELDVLVATPVIEVGIDIPNANIMMIESAERFGLASLHQLRGRIGRGGEEAFCLIFPSRYSKKSIKRLNYLTKYNNGLELAEVDMKMRGQGDLYGTEQHGFITFKIANPYDKNLINMANEDAKKIYKNIDKYPKLENKLKNETIDKIINN